MIKYAPDKTNSLGWYHAHLGCANNRYRTMVFSQPRAIRQGEELSNGWKEYGDPYDDATNGIRLEFIGDHPDRYISPRLPLQLLAFKPGNAPDDPPEKLPGVLPQDLRVGDILQTGCVVLEPPRPVIESIRPNGQPEIAVSLSGGQRPQTTAAPDDIELAVFGTIDHLGTTDDLLTRIVAEKLAQMRKSVLHSLAEHALFEAMIVRGRAA